MELSLKNLKVPVRSDVSIHKKYPMPFAVSPHLSFIICYHLEVHNSLWCCVRSSNPELFLVKISNKILAYARMTTHSNVHLCDLSKICSCKHSQSYIKIDLSKVQVNNTWPMWRTLFPTLTTSFLSLTPSGKAKTLITPQLEIRNCWVTKGVYFILVWLKENASEVFN
jgi:hypothetical protein